MRNWQKARTTCGRVTAGSPKHRSWRTWDSGNGMSGPAKSPGRTKCLRSSGWILPHSRPRSIPSSPSSPWPEEQQRGRELIQRATVSHLPGTYEQRFLLPDKSVGYYHSTFEGRYDNKGTLVTIVGTVLDITGPKKADLALRDKHMELNAAYEQLTATEEELRQNYEELAKSEQNLRASEQRLRRFYDAGLIGVIQWNTAGKITAANDKFLSMTGYTRDDLVAGSIDWAAMTPPEFHERDKIALAELKENRY